MRYWKFSQKTKLKQKFLLIVKKKWEIFFKTGTIVLHKMAYFSAEKVVSEYIGQSILRGTYLQVCFASLC